MSQKYTRRKFIKKSATLGAASLVGASFLPEIIGAAGETVPDIVCITGQDYAKGTAEAVGLLGGIGKFVSPGAKVAILPNAVGQYPATAVNPAVLMAVLQMCHAAGAGEVKLTKGVAEKYWDGFELTKDQAEILAKTPVSDADFAVLPIKNGVALKEAHISKDLMEADVFINVGHMKHHTGTQFTGLLKNLMGACPHNPTNRFFHFGSNAEDWYDDITFLSQCVADLNLLRKPDLCIGDSSSFITTNGPFGPGEIKTSNAVTAGTDPVSVDAYCTRFLGLKAEDVVMIEMSAKHGLGEDDLSQLNIKEATV